MVPSDGPGQDAENVAARRAAPRREPPAKPALREAPRRKPPAPKSFSGAALSSPRPALAQMSTNGSNNPAQEPGNVTCGVDALADLSSKTANELGPCPKQVPQYPLTKSNSPDFRLEPQHSTSEDENEDDDDDDLLRAVEAEVAATAEMLKSHNRRSAYSSSESDDSESDLDASNGSVGSSSSHRSSADSPGPTETAARDEAGASAPEAEREAEPDEDQTLDTTVETTPGGVGALVQDLARDRSAWARTPGPLSASTTPTKMRGDVSMTSPEMDVPTFSIRATRSISSCADAGTNLEAPATVPRPIARRVRALSLSSQHSRTTNCASHYNPSEPAATVAAVAWAGTKAVSGFENEEIVQLRQRVAALEKELAAKQSALIEAFAIIDQLSAVDRGVA